MTGPPTERFLSLLGCMTTPTDFNPAPGLGPMLKMSGPSKLAWFEPKTEAETRLKAASYILLRTKFKDDFTLEEHRTYRLALYAVYCEQGYSKGELGDFFPDMED